MQFLADLDLIKLLDAQRSTDKEDFKFDLYDEETNRGGLIRIGDINIRGVTYYGSVTEDLFPFLEQSIQKNGSYNILLMHFGIQGQDKNKVGINISGKIQSLQKKVDYLALGHYHKQYQLPVEDPWIFNPGSLEVVEANDVFSGFDRGAFLVRLEKNEDVGVDGGKFSWTQDITPILAANGAEDHPHYINNREFLSISIDVGSSDLTSFEKTKKYIMEMIPKKIGLLGKNEHSIRKEEDRPIETIKYPNTPLLYVFLKGTISYSKLNVNLREIKQMIMENFNLLDVRINAKIDSKLDGMKISGEEYSSIEQIENAVFTELIEQNKEYSPHKDEILSLMTDLKSALLDKNTENGDMANLIMEWWDNNTISEELSQVEGSDLDIMDESVSKSELEPKSEFESETGSKSEDKEPKTQGTEEEMISFRSDYIAEDEEDEEEIEIEEPDFF